MIFQIIGAVAAFGLAIYIIFVVLSKKKLELIKRKTTSSLEEYGDIRIEGKKTFFKTTKRNYQVLFCYVSGNGELTINSRTMWEIINSGTSQVIDQTNFLASNDPKIVIIYPSTHVIKRYINENEMVFVKPTDYFYDMHIIRDIELEAVLKEGIL